MFDLPLQSLLPNDLPVSHTGSDRLPFRSRERADGTTSFSHALAKASASQSRTDEQEHDVVGRAAVERNRAVRKNEHQTAHAAPVKERHTDKEQQVDQDRAAGPHHSAPAADVAAGNAAQQAAAVTTPPAKETPEKNMEVTLSWTGSGDDVKVSVQGLPEELLTGLLSAFGNGSGAAQAATPGATKLFVDSAPDANGLGSASDGNDASKGMNEIASLIQSLTEALQKKVSEMVKLHPGNAPTAGLKASDAFAQLGKEATADGAPITPGLNPGLAQRLTAAFKDLVSMLRTQDAKAATNGSTGLNGPDQVPNVAPELKLPQATDLTESLFSKVKVTVSLPGVVEGAAGTANKGAGLPSEGNGKSAFGEQGATMQAGIQRQEPVVEGPNTTSFGSIVADRLAAVAEQVWLREKPLDITLRLKMEGGESLMVGLKDQAGKIIVQIRSADGNMVNFLESQKETIVRHLEAKQISSTISVSPIEEDLTKRQGREQPKNMWGRRREPSDPNMETSI